MLGILCATCRQDFHCGRCACCMSEFKLAKRVKRIKRIMAKPIRPEDIGKIESEHAQQVALFAWAALNTTKYPELAMMFAIPNGGLRNKITAANLKAEGVRASVSDIFLPVARGPWHGLFIEMKKIPGKQPAGRATPEQLEFLAAVRWQGFGGRVCVGWEAARDTIVQYLEWKP